jgi:hypothetical protein
VNPNTWVVWVTVVGGVAGLLGGAVGWVSRTLSSVHKRESEVWATMEKRLEVLETRDQECESEIKALNQTLLLVTQENGLLRGRLARIETITGINTIEKAIEAEKGTGT